MGFVLGFFKNHYSTIAISLNVLLYQAYFTHEEAAV